MSSRFANPTLTSNSSSPILTVILWMKIFMGIRRVRFNKPLHYPDVIGGHFTISNTELLLKSYDFEFLQLILGSNEERKKEIKDEIIYAEVLQNKLVDKLRVDY